MNAAGPWGESIARMAGADVPVQPSPGVLLAVHGRWCNMVLNRLHKSGDGDIIVPQRGLSVIGTSSWVVDDPDNIDVPEDHIQKMYREGAMLVPEVATAKLRSAWSAARPLIGSRGASSGRELSRTFKCFDHAEDDGVEGFVTITGGKGTTLRGMAEAAANVVARKLGVDARVPDARGRPPPPHRVLRAGGGGVTALTGAPVPAADPAAATAPARPTTGAGSTSPAVKTVRVRVFRWRAGDAAPHQDEFSVPIATRSTVLDALTYIRVKLDPSLNLRHSCCHASCGTCGLRVNGRDVLACVTNVADLGADTLTVEPLLNAPVVSDLVVDMADFYAAFNPMDRPLVRTSEKIPEAGIPEGLTEYQRYEDCIECGICVSACPIAATDPHYLGPAALAAAFRVLAEPRESDPVRTLRIADDEHGAWRCHVAFECSEACPSGSTRRVRS